MASQIAKEKHEKIGLKRQGHGLIDRIKWKGYSKDFIYLELAKLMGCEEHQAHFMSMNALHELREAVEHLRTLEKRLPETEFASKAHRHKRVQKIAKIIAEPKVKIPPPPPGPKAAKRAAKKAQKKADVLPRDAYLKAMEEMKTAHERVSVELFDDNLAGPWSVIPPLADSPVVVAFSPRESWVYTMYKKIKWW